MSVKAGFGFPWTRYRMTAQENMDVIHQDKAQLSSGETIVAMACHATTLRIAMPGGVDLALDLAAGERALIVATDDASLVGSLQFAPFDLSRVVRMFAFFEHCNRRTDITDAPWPQVTVCRSWRQLEDTDDALSWMIDIIAGDAPELPVLRQVWRQSEIYQLVRFVLSNDAGENIDDMAQRYGLSVSHFRRKCRRVFDRPLKQELRILRAARALLGYPASARSITRLAEDHGYASPSHFCSEIKSLVGIAPRDIFRAVTPV